MISAVTLDADVGQALARQVGEFPDPAPDPVRATEAAQRELAETFNVWVLLTVDDVGRGEPLFELARETGSRHHQIRRAGTACQFARSTYDKEPKIEAVCHSSLAEHLDRGVAVADRELSATFDGEARLLEVGSLGVTALWLAGVSDNLFLVLGSEDQVTPVLDERAFGDWLRTQPTRMKPRTAA